MENYTILHSSRRFSFFINSIQQVNACRWRMGEEDAPMLHQYVEFKKGLPIQLEPVSWCSSSLCLARSSSRLQERWNKLRRRTPASQPVLNRDLQVTKKQNNKIKIAVYVYVILFFTRNLLLLWCIGIMVYVSPEMGDTYGTGFGTSHAGLKPEPPVVALAISIISSRWFSIATAVIHLQLCIICLVSYEKVFNQ